MKKFSLIILSLFFSANLYAQSVLNTPAAAGQPSEPKGITDHELVLNSFGMQALMTDPIAGVIDVVGVRYWINDRFGLDLGLGIYVNKPYSGDTQFGFGLMAGVPIAFGVYKHLTLFIEPQLDFELFHAAKDTNPWSFGLGGYGGAELTFGWIGVPRLSLLAKVGLSLRVNNNGDDNQIVFKTDKGFPFAAGLGANVGVIYYF
ncbi:MAG: hypothetical protein FJ088_07390 [Deltaproteobacteria bacterium]|nr:hypothetical protein [Deltaproteobacteria bacterium]